MTPSYPRTKNALAGVVFFGTPHADTDSEALLQSVKGTIDTFGPKDGVKSKDVREFVSIVSRINTTFIACKPSYLRLLSFWENLPSKTPGSSTDSHKAPVSLLSFFDKPTKYFLADTLIGHSSPMPERETTGKHRSHNRVQP